MMKRGLSCLALLAALSSSATAATPLQFSVQGVVRTAQGSLQTSSSMVTVSLYDAQTGGTQIAGPYGPTAVMVQNGLFTMTLPLTPADVTAMNGASALWLEVTVDSETYSRQLVTPEVYSLMCGSADDSAKLGGQTASAYLTTAAASSTYLTQANAASTYLTQASAASTYLKQTDAASTYLTQANAGSTYLKQSDAASTYLTQANAASTYLTQTAAASKYVDTANNQTNIGGNKTFTGTVTANALAGDGAAVTNIKGGNIQAGTVTYTQAGSGIVSNQASITNVAFTKALPHGTYQQFSAWCPANYLPMGGKCENSSNGTDDVRLLGAGVFNPAVNTWGYFCWYENPTATDYTYTVTAYCYPHP